MLDLSNVSACLISKDSIYPKRVLEHTSSFPFGEILVLTHSDSPYRKHELFAKAKFEWLYYSDDDCIAPIEELAKEAEPGLITLAMKPGHFEAYKNTRMTMGIGWGAFFQKKLLKNLDIYTAKYGEDFLFKRDTEKILTALCYPQKRLVMHIEDLPSAMAADRLWREKEHYNYGNLCEARVRELISARQSTTE